VWLIKPDELSAGGQSVGPGVDDLARRVDELNGPARIEEGTGSALPYQDHDGPGSHGAVCVVQEPVLPIGRADLPSGEAHRTRPIVPNVNLLAEGLADSWCTGGVTARRRSLGTRAS